MCPPRPIVVLLEVAIPNLSENRLHNQKEELVTSKLGLRRLSMLRDGLAISRILLPHTHLVAVFRVKQLSLVLPQTLFLLLLLLLLGRRLGALLLALHVGPL